MAAPKTIHLAPNGSGDWIMRDAEGQAGEVFATRAEAERAAQARVRDAGGQLLIHGEGDRRTKSFTLGRAAMAKLNAVEGVALTAAGAAAFKSFDRERLTPAQRRAALRDGVAELAAKDTGGRRRAAPKG